MEEMDRIQIYQPHVVKNLVLPEDSPNSFILKKNDNRFKFSLDAVDLSILVIRCLNSYTLIKQHLFVVFICQKSLPK